MAELTIQWPDAGADRVTEARARLSASRPGLLRRDHREIVEVVGRVMEAFADPKQGEGAKLVRGLADAGAFSSATLERGLTLALEGWHREAVRGLVDLELEPAFAAGRRLRPFATTAVVLGGGIPMPSLLACLAPLLVRSPVLAKTASRDRVTAHRVAACLRELDPELGESLAVLDFDADDEAALGAFLEAPCVVASGSDETTAALASKLGPHQRLVSYGHRFSVAAIDAGSTLDLEAAARALALDCALWDQSGCLSPICAHVVGGDTSAAQRFSRALADELQRLAHAMPRSAVETAVAASIRGERDEAAMRGAAGRDVEVFAADDSAWTVVREDEPDLRSAPLHRFMRVHAVPHVDAWTQALAPHARHLSTVGVSGAGPAARQLASRGIELGASRVCELGRMQAPPLDWPHDGRPVLGALASWAAIEAGPGTIEA